jgi:linoleoyl-CoA desaturase
MVYSDVRFVDRNPDKNQFFATLRKNVDGYFKENNISKHHNAEMVIKTIVLLAAYLLPFVALLIFQPSLGVSMILWAIMGFALAGIGMSVMHDANHGGYSINKQVNNWLGYSLNLLGGSVFNWKMQHNVLHHTYTNIEGVDDDIDDKMFFRFTPHKDPKWYHKLQFIYAFFIYGLTTVYWVVMKDFAQFARYTKEGVNRNTKEQNRVVLLKIILFKLAYIFSILIVPIFVIGIPAGQVIGGFLLMHFIAGVVLTVIFQLAHVVEDTSYPLPDENGHIENTWAIHQMNTTVNFAHKNKVLSWYIGGLNYQVEHHLFPTICHVHYPKIAPIVKATAEQFGVPYLENRTFWQALNSHITTLIRFGRTPSMDEAIV